MADLTREQIEQLQERSNIVVRRFGDDTDPAHVFVQMPVDRIQALCAMALRAIDAGWRSMESAPRDRQVLVQRHGVRFVGRWDWNEKRWHGGPCPYAETDGMEAWHPLPPPFTGDPDARRTVAATDVDGNGTGNGGEHGE